MLCSNKKKNKTKFKNTPKSSVRQTFGFACKCATTWHLYKSFAGLAHREKHSVLLGSAWSGLTGTCLMLGCAAQLAALVCVICCVQIQHRQGVKKKTKKKKRKKNCLIKRVPLKSAMKCRIWFVGNACENRGKRRTTSVFENERCLIASVGGCWPGARKMAVSSNCQQELQTVETSLSPWRCKEYYLTINDGQPKAIESFDLKVNL